ncbi:hypothetical protein VE25_04110 [Devosia geojensis]|uniref:Oxidoreductase n=1 Tax=Devosia geojensis TaxID=443610 RepID=A0A0F5FW05_9HYPH|nr:DUF423 domain-containing protein [Devosia geojensis]KKB13024.1 hypothetical protein VE25_04110 [Devosia geojensis]
MTRLRAIGLLASGLIGGAGILAAAGSAHAGASQALVSATTVCLAHAPALLVLALAGKGRWMGVAGVLLALGTLIFVSDMALREFAGVRLLPLAAPLGGLLMIAGWLSIAIGGIAILWRSGDTLP